MTADCDSFLDEEDRCEVSANGEHRCVLAGGHQQAHECDCGVTW
jgi:hypothetical protein